MNREADLIKRREAWLDDPRREAETDALLDAARNGEVGEAEAMGHCPDCGEVDTLDGWPVACRCEGD